MDKEKEERPKPVEFPRILLYDPDLDPYGGIHD